jgi:hypothetical protein
MGLDEPARVGHVDLKVHALLSAAYIAGHAALDLAGLPFELSVDWMWMADAADLRDRLLETLYYFGAFPPGMNLATGLLLKVGEAHAVVLAHAWFWTLGLVLLNALFFVARASGLSTRAAAVLALAFSFIPPSIYFGHVYHYEWVVTTLLCGVVALFVQGVRRPTTGVWFACFLAALMVPLTRSTFHPAWFVLIVAFSVRSVPKQARRRVVIAAVAPAVLLFGVCLKNFWLFDDFAVAIYGPSSVTLSTVAHLPYDIRDRWIESGSLSPFAAMNVYAPPREYARFFGSPEHPGWPPQLTRLEHASANAPNYNHWWLLKVHRARRSDVFHYVRTLPLDYVSNVARNVVEMMGPTTRWHPRDDTPMSPHRRHRWLLGGYEHWFNSAMHRFPVAPVGVYFFLPIPLAWAGLRAWRGSKSADPDTRARSALLTLLAFLIVYVFAASALLTSLKMARYRFQVEAFIWIVTAATLRRRR